jgi:cell division protein FtsZ
MANLNQFAPSSASAAISQSIGTQVTAASGPSAATGVTAMQQTHSAPTPSAGSDYGSFETPAVFRNTRESSPQTLGADSSPQAKAMLEKGTDYYEIPAFLRKQAD